MSKFNSHIKIVDGESKSLEESVMNPFDLFLLFLFCFFNKYWMWWWWWRAHTHFTVHNPRVCVCVCGSVCESCLWSGSQEGGRVCPIHPEKWKCTHIIQNGSAFSCRHECWKDRRAFNPYSWPWAEWGFPPPHRALKAHSVSGIRMFFFFFYRKMSCHSINVLLV